MSHWPATLMVCPDRSSDLWPRHIGYHHSAPCLIGLFPVPHHLPMNCRRIHPPRTLIGQEDHPMRAGEPVSYSWRWRTCPRRAGKRRLLSARPGTSSEPIKKAATRIVPHSVSRRSPENTTDFFLSFQLARKEVLKTHLKAEMYFLLSSNYKTFLGQRDTFRIIKYL